MTRTSLAIFLAVSMAATVGCTSKNYVKQQTTPLINKTNELDDMTAKNSKDIKDVDARAQAGIQAVNAKTADVEQKAQAAGQSASSAQQVADAANSRVGVLTNTVANLDNYRPVAETSVKFGFNKDNLTPKSMEALDQLEYFQHLGLYYRARRQHGLRRFGGLQLQSEPAPRELGDPVSGIEVQRAGAQDLRDRIGQGQAGRDEQD
jgi:hypothetical protein